MEAAKQWSDFWTGALSGKPSEKPRDRRFSAAEWQDDPYYRAIRDAYLLASKQLRDMVGEDRRQRLARSDGPLPARPISERDCADQFRGDQPRGRQAHQGNRRREPGPGLRQPPRGRRQRQRHRPAPHRPERVREGQDHRRDAGRGRLRERAVPADPVHAGDREGRGRAVALRAAAGEPLLHDRPRAAAEPGQMAGRRGPHGVRHQLGQSRRRSTRTRTSAIMSSTGVVEAIGEVRKRTGTAPDLFSFCLGGTLVAIALAWLAAKGRAEGGQSAPPDRLAGRLFRHARLVGVRPRRPSRRARGSSREPGLCRQPASFSGCSRRCAPTT